MPVYLGTQIEAEVTRTVRVEFDEFDPQDVIAAINECLMKSKSTRVRIMQEISGGDTLVGYKPNSEERGCFALMVDDPADLYHTVTEVIQCWDREWTGDWDMEPSRIGEGSEPDSHATLLLTTRKHESKWEDASERH